MRKDVNMDKNLEALANEGSKAIEHNDEYALTVGEGFELLKHFGENRLLQLISCVYDIGFARGVKMSKEQYELRDAQSLEDAFPAQYDAVESQEINAMRDFLSGRGFKLNDFELIATIAAVYRAGKGALALEKKK